MTGDDAANNLVAPGGYPQKYQNPDDVKPVDGDVRLETFPRGRVSVYNGPKEAWQTITMA